MARSSYGTKTTLCPYTEANILTLRPRASRIFKRRCSPKISLVEMMSAATCGASVAYSEAGFNRGYPFANAAQQRLACVVLGFVGFAVTEAITEAVGCEIGQFIHHHVTGGCAAAIRLGSVDVRLPTRSPPLPAFSSS